MQVLCELDGVMRGDKDQPISQGIILIGSLSAWNKITLMSPFGAKETQQWLDVNKIADFDHIVDSSVSLVDAELSERQILYARSMGAIDLFITNSPTNWAFAFDLGIPSAMFGVPSYTRPEFRPDAPKRVRTWDSIEKAVEGQNALRTAAVRQVRSENIQFGD